MEQGNSFGNRSSVNPDVVFMGAGRCTVYCYSSIISGMCMFFGVYEQDREEYNSNYPCSSCI